MIVDQKNARDAIESLLRRDRLSLDDLFRMRETLATTTPLKGDQAQVGAASGCDVNDRPYDSSSRDMTLAS